MCFFAKKHPKKDHKTKGPEIENALSYFHATL